MVMLFILFYMIVFQINKDLIVKACLKYSDKITFLTTLLRSLTHGNCIYL